MNESSETALSGLYRKHHSFEGFRGSGEDAIEVQKRRAIAALQDSDLRKRSARSPSWFSVLDRALEELLEGGDQARFRITQFIADEMQLLRDDELIRFLFHRFRYDVFPQLGELDDYPPYLQIEPTSICNYRCVFCYQTDAEFTKKSNGFMGTMTLDTYRRIIDAIDGNIEFLSLASRGEPTACKDLAAMLDYSRDRFLNLKLNTNASLLKEEHIHSILSGGVRTLVFSADAAEEPLYSQLRVNGKLDRVLKNVELFQKIRQTQYSTARIITRVSGVKFDDRQDFDAMNNLWGNYVDQVAFVKYNPWESIYDSKANGVQEPCTDLWRRMFVWFDGTANPCDSDYRSTLKVGTVYDSTLTELWHSETYAMLRQGHNSGSRQQIEPCRRCSVV